MVSGVTSRSTGTSSSTLSSRPPVSVALNWTFAVPSASDFDGHATRVESPGATVIVLVCGPLTVTPSAFSVTSTLEAVAVPLRTSARISDESPTRRNRGRAGRTSSGFVERSSLVPSPTIVSPLTARTCIRQVVRLSGIFTSTVAVPSSFVVSCALQYAVFRKSCRVFDRARPLPVFCPRAASATASLYRSTDTDIDDAVFTLSPRSNQNAWRPSGPRSSASASTALSTTLTETSERTPRPSLFVTLMSYFTVSPGFACARSGFTATASVRVDVDTGSWT